MMVRTPLRSSALRQVDYDPDSEQMTLHFPNGRSATYSSVPSSVYDGLVNSDSPGTYFNQNIKGNY